MIPASASSPRSSGSARRDLLVPDLLVPAACGLVAVLAMYGVAAAGLAVLGVRPAGGTGAPGTALVVAAAAGAPVELTAHLTLGRFALTLPGDVRAVPLVVTLTGMLVLAGASPLLRPVPGRGRAAARAAVAATVTAAGCGVLAGTGEVHGGLGGRLAVDAVPHVGAAVLGGLVLAAVALAPAVLSARASHRGHPRWRAPVLAGVLLVAVVAAPLGGAVVAGHRGDDRGRWLLAVPNVALQAVSRGAGVPWSSGLSPELPGRTSPASSPSVLRGLLNGTPDDGPDGASDGPASRGIPGLGTGPVLGGDGASSLPGTLSPRLRTLASAARAGRRAAVAALLVVVLARGLVLRARGDRRTAAGRAVRYGLTGAVALALATRAASLTLRVDLPFEGGPGPSLRLAGDSALAVVIGLGWGLLAAVLVTGLARIPVPVGGRRILASPADRPGEARGEAPGERVPAGGAGVDGGRGPRW